MHIYAFIRHLPDVFVQCVQTGSILFEGFCRQEGGWWVGWLVPVFELLIDTAHTRTWPRPPILKSFCKTHSINPASEQELCFDVESFFLTTSFSGKQTKVTQHEQNLSLEEKTFFSDNKLF